MEPTAPDIRDISQPLSPQRPRRFWAAVAAAVVLLCIADLELSAPKGYPEGATVFTINQGEALEKVGASLSDGGYIRSTLVFGTLVIAFGGEHRISPGDYYFPHDESVFGIAWQVAHDDHNVEPIKVTVPEGENVTEISQLLAEKLPNFDTKAFLAAATPDEGYLFPETYFFFPTVTTDAVVQEMRAMFDTQTVGLFTDVASTGHTEKDIVTMASLVEREAHGDDDRAMIAGILWNRIRLGMRLQVDATVAFAAGVGDGALTKADFSIDSPYNTYTHGGLPPGPIANPGLDAIKAALNPADTAYLYYLHDKNGSIHYAKTYAEHQANIAKYLR